MKKLMGKTNKKGFTLAELLVVVAIIAILVAVSIPIFTTNLHNAADSTDQANMRAAKAAAVVAYLSNNETAAKTYYYDAANGAVKDTKSGITGYNQCDKTDCEVSGAKATKNTKVVKVTVAADGATVTAAWE